MNMLKYVGLACLTGVGLIGLAEANPYGARQYYSNWNYTPNYSYRYYYYKPTPYYSGYKHNYVVYYPKSPSYYYYYSPYSKQFWGRCPSTYYGSGYDGKPTYAFLPPETRPAPNVAVAPPAEVPVPKAPFPDGGPLPKVPETQAAEGKDQPNLDLPPDDPPPTKVAPAGVAN